MTPDPAPADNSGRQPVSPAVRRRLQASFEHGTKSAAGGNFDYATNMFLQCVKGDPGNPIYITQFLNNLYKKYKDNKKGAGFTSMANASMQKGSIKKAAYSKDWPSLISAGLEMLKINPWDVSTLMAMAEAADALNMDEAQLTYLKRALDVNPKDPDTNRVCGRTLARMGQYDQAIACWHRVEQAKPGDDEAARAIGELAIEKTISQGGYEGAENSTDVMADRAAQADRRSEATIKLSPVDQLEKQLAKKPDDVQLYLELADLHTREERHDKAEEVLNRALQASGGDGTVRERLEDAQRRRAMNQLRIAQKQDAEKNTPESKALVKRMQIELNSLEIDLYRSRSERYPNDAALKYELGLRLKLAGQYNEAINLFQKAGADGKRKAMVFMELGECFQQIKQYKLAMDNYERAVEATVDRDPEQRKRALYRAGKLALGLAEKYTGTDPAQAKGYFARAEKYLNELAGLDFGYKDTPQLLDKIAKIGHKV